jgi:hypothetical protein
VKQNQLRSTVVLLLRHIRYFLDHSSLVGPLLPSARSRQTKQNQCSFVLPRYRERISHVSRTLKLRPRSPVEEAADLIEYVQAVGNLKHLKPRGLELPFYQFYMLDVFLVLGIACSIVLSITVTLVRRVVKKCCRSSKKAKTS